MQLYKRGKVWTLDVHLNRRRIRKTIYNLRLAKKMLKILQDFKDIEAGREFLYDMQKYKMINDEQAAAFKVFLDKEYSNITEGEKEQIKILVNEFTEAAYDK